MLDKKNERHKPLHFLLGEVLPHFSGEMVEAMQCAGMKQSITRLPENRGHFVIVVGHQLGFGGLLRQSKQSVDILDCLESFLK